MDTASLSDCSLHHLTAVWLQSFFVTFDSEDLLNTVANLFNWLCQVLAIFLITIFSYSKIERPSKKNNKRNHVHKNQRKYFECDFAIVQT
jgi:predicted membrane protein